MTAVETAVAQGALTREAISGFRAEFSQAEGSRLAQNAVTRVGLEEAALDHQLIVSTPTTMTHRLDDWKVANQKKSGRCWLFAALNLLRVGVKEKLGVKDFELSQNHAMFWDKLERANFFLEDIVATAGEDLDSRTVQTILADVLGDGGQWDMAVSVFQRHGVVPKSAMPETQPSSNTAAMNGQLRLKLRKATLELRASVAEGASAAELAAAKRAVLADVYRILTINLGTPPESFEWEWRDDERQFHRDGVITPQEFFARYVTIDLSDYICLVDDPRSQHPKGGALTIAHLGNVVGGQPIRYINAPIDTMKRLAAESIAGGEPVWFGCDVGQQSERKEGLMLGRLRDYSGVLGVDLSTSKEERVVSGESEMTHAMLLTGVDVTDGRTRRWRVENSWGDESGDQGFYTMDDDWFTDYVFEVVVRKSALPEELRAAVTADPIVLPAWDPMGSLA